MTTGARDSARSVPLGAVYALAAAVLFGVSTPLAKLLVGQIHPVMLAGLLYLGCGLGLAVLRLVGGVLRLGSSEARLRRSDLPWLAGATVAGGMLGPVLLMVGLRLTSGASASLLLNMEGVLTAALAWLVFREHVSARVAVGMGAVVAGGVVLAWGGGEATAGSVWGSVAVLGACLAWAVDNNLTRAVSARDPLQIASVKGLVAGAVNVVIALCIGAGVAGPGRTLAAGTVGLFGYGVSLALFVLALRHVGAARTGAYFGTAPFIGAVVAVLLLREAVGARLLVAGALMALGVGLNLSERHAHLHAHGGLTHDHRHIHADAHHAHGHKGDADAEAAHAHPHAHEPLVHAHPHFPDIHHGHDHADRGEGDHRRT